MKLLIFSIDKNEDMNLVFIFCEIVAIGAFHHRFCTNLLGIAPKSNFPPFIWIRGERRDVDRMQTEKISLTSSCLVSTLWALGLVPCSAALL